MILLSLLLLLLAGVPAWGLTRYVHPSGLATNTPCTSAAAPCTLLEAVKAAQTGDIVLFQNSTEHIWPEQNTVRSGVTYRGETACTVTTRDNNGYPVNVSCPVRWKCSTGQPCLNIKHPSTVVENFELDGQLHSGGIEMKINASNSIVQRMYIHHTNRAGISVCGDNPCDNITIRGNIIRDTGFNGPGEALYFGSATATMVNFVTNIQAYGNFLQRFTSNGVDCKRNTGSVTQEGCNIHHNVFTGQLYRPISQKCNSEGTLLSTGAGSRWIKNIIRDSGQNSVAGDCIPAGELGFDVGVVLLGTRGAVRENAAQGNVIMNIRGAFEMMASTTFGEGHANFATSPATTYTGNYFCNNSTYAQDPISPHIMTANTGIPGGAAQSVCNTQVATIMNEMAALSGLTDGFPFAFGGATPPLPVPRFVSCTAPTGGTTIVCTVDAQTSTPMLPATGITGFTARKNPPTAWTISSVARTANEQITLTMGSAAVSGDVIDISYNQGTGNLTNTAGTEIEPVTNFPVTNAVAPTPTFTGLATWRLYPANCIVTLPHCRPLATEFSAAGRKFRPDSKLQVAMSVDVTGANAAAQGFGLRCKVNAGAFFQVDHTTVPIRIGTNPAADLDEMCTGIQAANYCHYLHTRNGVSLAQQVNAGQRYSLVPTLQFTTPGLVDTDTVTCEPTLADGTQMTVTNAFTLTIGTHANSIIYSAD